MPQTNSASMRRAPVNKEIVDLASANYAQVLPLNGRFTFADWANAIKEAYDVNEPHNRAVFNELANSDGWIHRSPAGDKVAFSKFRRPAPHREITDPEAEIISLEKELTKPVGIAPQAPAGPDA